MNIATILDRNISDSRLNVSAIYINSGIPPKRFDLLFISLISRKFTSWQDMFSLYLESFTSGFCGEAPGAEV